MTSVRRAAKKMAIWDRYTGRYLVWENNRIALLTKATDADVMWYRRWLAAKKHASGRVTPHEALRN